jgi:predicted solute-binding protein
MHEGDYSCWIINPRPDGKLHGVITNSFPHLKEALEKNINVLLITTEQLKFMYNCDLGEKWKRLAALPPVFTHHNGKIVAIIRAKEILTKKCNMRKVKNEQT